jgi:hypothetical protein
MVVDLTVKGWIPKSGKIDRLCETLKKLNLTEIDTVVIDSMSNTAFLGTDEDGLPIPTEKSIEDGRYHLNGDLQLAPPSALKSTMKLVEKICSNVGGAKTLLTVPLPRYVLVACCDDTNHVSNRQDPDFFREISGSKKSLTDAAAAGNLTSDAKILNILEFLGPRESPLLSTVDGTSIWAGDGVHLTSNATRVAATKLMAHIAGGGEKQEPATKRARLEAVIPVRVTPPPAGKAAMAAPAPPPPPKPVPPPCGCAASCRRTCTDKTTREVSSAEGGAATTREEASQDRRRLPRPGAGTGAGPNSKKVSCLKNEK